MYTVRPGCYQILQQGYLTLARQGREIFPQGMTFGVGLKGKQKLANLREINSQENLEDLHCLGLEGGQTLETIKGYEGSLGGNEKL